MPYALLIHEDRARRPQRSPSEGRAEYEQMQRFGAELQARGLLRASDALKPDAEGARVRIRDGRTLIVDGPFSESKEMIGGFFVFDCDSREQALAIAAQCPAAQWATVEVREIGRCCDG
ncbi:MAG: YciI family protein [Nevskia sp.]